MSYQANDRSEHDAEPVECYKFITPLQSFLYTSNPTPVEVDGEWYEPLNIERGPIETNSLMDSGVTVDFMVPVTSGIARLVAFRRTPESVIVEVRRAHRSDNMNT